MSEKKLCRAFQRFPGATGPKSPYLKLPNIDFPKDMRGVSMLDVGCAEGFFCIEAVRRGATRVVGVDINPYMIESAKRITPEGIQFEVKNAFDITERFDIVLFLAILHHQKYPKKMLERMYGLTKDLMIAEVILHKKTHRKGIKFFPTREWFLDAMNDIGWNSVVEVGETWWKKQRRLVFHCRREKKYV